VEAGSYDGDLLVEPEVRQLGEARLQALPRRSLKVVADLVAVLRHRRARGRVREEERDVELPERAHLGLRDLGQVDAVGGLVGHAVRVAPAASEPDLALGAAPERTRARRRAQDVLTVPRVAPDVAHLRLREERERSVRRAELVATGTERRLHVAVARDDL